MGAELNNQLLTQEIIDQAISYGASAAGIASVAALRQSKSYKQYEQNPYYAHFTSLPGWPEEAKSVLVFGVRHQQSEPELDWWDPRLGGTPGNRILIQIQKKLVGWLQGEKGIQTQPLAYQIEKGGIFLKDAAALAGIGIIGKHNLFISPEFGPQIRLRAMFLYQELTLTRPLDSDPCTACDRPCFRACPQNAFRNGYYERECCQIQMQIDEDHPFSPDEQPETIQIRYCRACELSCPEAR